MASEERCTCCDLPVIMCGRTAERRRGEEAKRERAAWFAQPGVIPAQYPGRCPRCGEGWISEGDPIRYDKAGLVWAGVLCCGTLP